jgi:hypothetical protein
MSLSKSETNQVGIPLGHVSLSRQYRNAKGSNVPAEMGSTS